MMDKLLQKYIDAKHGFIQMIDLVSNFDGEFSTREREQRANSIHMAVASYQLIRTCA
jgi:hypothetical protein